jgi:hypothetical protein
VRHTIQQRLASGYRNMLRQESKVGRIRRVKMENAQLLKKHKDCEIFKKGKYSRNRYHGWEKY